MKKILKPVVGILFGLTVALVTVEIAARVMVGQGTLPNRMVADIFAAHAIGWALEPELNARVISTNGMVEIKVNQRGFRDQDYPQERAAGRPRVLVLGDSFTLALETPQADTFHTLLEDRYGGAVDVISMGVSGYEIVQDFLAYQFIGRAYDPDVVLLMLYVGNDLTGNQHWTHLPYYSLEPDGSLALHNYPYEGKFDLPLVVGQRSTPLMRRSMLAFLVGTVVRNRETDARLDRDLCSYQSGENFPQVQEEDWALSEALIVAFRDAVQADGKQFRVAVIPTEFQAEQFLLDEFLSTCTPPEWVSSPPYQPPYQERLAAFLGANGIEYLDLLPVLRAASQSTGTLMYLAGSDTHWTKEGHVVVADALYQWLNLGP